MAVTAAAAAAVASSVGSQRFLPLSSPSSSSSRPKISLPSSFHSSDRRRTRNRGHAIVSAAIRNDSSPFKEVELVPKDVAQDSQFEGFAFEGSSAAAAGGGDLDVVGGSGGDGGSSFPPPPSPCSSQMVDRAINAAIVLAAGTFAITKLLTIDRDYWQGWTVYEILRYAPLHNWVAYEEALKANPVLAKMMISGVVYSVGDWIAQCYEGKPLFDFDRTRMFRSGLVGFTLHGSLSHYYYYFCEAIFPSQDWWVVPAKVLFDQTVWAALWNSIYFVVLGLLRFESPVTIYSELKATFLPMLTAGWKLWPFAHLVTYGVIPVEQRLLWVDCVELVWVTILSTYSNEKSEARHSDALPESNSGSIEE